MTSREQPQPFSVGGNPTSEPAGLPSEHGTADGPTVLRPLLLSIPQTLVLLDIGRTTLYQLMADEELVPIRIGRSVRFVVSEVEAFVEARCAARGTGRSARRSCQTIGSSRMRTRSAVITTTAPN